MLKAARTGSVVSAAAGVLGGARALLPLSRLPTAWRWLPVPGKQHKEDGHVTPGQVNLSQLGQQQHHLQWVPAPPFTVSRVTAAFLVFPLFNTEHTARGTAENRELLSPENILKY